MNQVISYLQTKVVPDELILLAGRTDSMEFVRDVLQSVSWKRVSIIASECQIEEKICREIERIKKDTDTGLSDVIIVKSCIESDFCTGHRGECAVVFDSLASVETLEPLLGLSPRYLAGECTASDISSFEVWEKAHLSVKNIYLLSRFESEKTEALLWEADEKYTYELSVIIPMYNVAAYLPQCIESCIVWDAAYVEYLFIDDGSPDNCAEIVSEYAKRDSRVKLLQKENGGCASARQYGLERAKGRYIGFIDPDDYIDPEMFRKLLMRAMAGSYEIAYCGFNEVYEDSGTISKANEPVGSPYNAGTSDSELINALIMRLTPVIWRRIHLKELLTRENIHFYTDLKMSDDLPFHVETLFCAKSVVSVPEHLYYYRLARPGQDAQINDERLFVFFTILGYLDDFVKRSPDTSRTEVLQVRKLYAHMYVLRKIQRKYFGEYLKRAKADIRKNYGLFDGIEVIRRRTSTKCAVIYLVLHLGNKTLLRGVLVAWKIWSCIKGVFKRRIVRKSENKRLEKQSIS